MSPPLIFFGTLQLSYWVGKLNLPHLPEIHSQLKKKNVKCPKARVRWPMHHCLLTESLPQWSLIDSYHQVGPNVELTNSWAGEVSVGISLMVAYWQGRAMYCPIAGQDLLLSNRMWSNTPKQSIPANGCAHGALFHKDTLGPVCFNLIDWLLSHLRFLFHRLV